MPNSFPESYLIRQHFTDVEEFGETVREWDLDFRQLNPGDLDCDLLQAGVDDMHLTHVNFARRIDQRGISPAAGRTFALLDRPSTLEWCGRQIDQNDIMAFHPSGEYESASAPGFQVFTLTFPLGYLEQLANSLEMQGCRNIVASHEEALVGDATRVKFLRHRLRAVRRTLRTTTEPAGLSFFAEQIKEDIPRTLLATIKSSTTTMKKPSQDKRIRALQRARDFIRHAGGDPIRMSDLCKITGASERTLEYAFKDSYGVTPKMFIKAYRLNGVRRQLRRANPQAARITDIANGWGFWHMGQFAADYRRLFGELPSATLRKRGHSYIRGK